MADNKKFYWLKLKRDFFKRHDVRIIEEMPNGKDYILFYLKLLLESIDHEGELRFSDTIPYNEQMLSVITNTNVDIVRSAMKVFAELNMIEIFDDKTIFMAEVQKLIGSETAGAERVRKHRQNQRLLQSNTKETKSNTEIEIEEEKEEEKEFHSFIHSAEEKEAMKQTYLGGTLGGGVVLLSREQFDSLLDTLSLDEFNKYVGIIRDEELKGHHYTKKTHYQAILDMAEKDRRI